MTDAGLARAAQLSSPATKFEELQAYRKDTFWSCTALKDYFYRFWESFNYAYDVAQSTKDKVDLAKKRAKAAKEYESQNMPTTAEAEIKKIVPSL